MQRYFVHNAEDNGDFTIIGEDCHHIVKVMRMKLDDQIICVDGAGRSMVCSIAEMTGEAVTVKIVQLLEESPELPVKVTIASGLPKGDKLELILQKGTELGGYEFVPFAAARSVVKWDEKKSAKKIERWQKICKEAAEQSHRSHVPIVHNVLSFKNLIELSKNYTHKIVAFEEEARAGESSVLSSVFKSMNSGDTLLMVFGPEGGLANPEVDSLVENGFVACGLGPRILRTETAPLYALASVSYHFELMR